ncbi:MAG: GxxExxY protein [Flaviaesturariibacter sp.]|nr:GxxExxY protein [Flaviaesturariibacter sp.]
MKESNLKYGDLTQKIIGCAMKVHSRMKNGYIERVYQKCMAIELQKAGVLYKEEIDMPIFYDDKIVGRRRADFIVDEKVVIEIKAITNLENEHIAQALNYLETSGLEICLLINFGSKSLQFKRLINENKSLALKHPINPINP